MSARINPSILSADFVNFERDFGTIANCDLIHVDVMDNNFVPNLTFGLPMVARMQQIAPKPLDIHLMIANVDNWAGGYAETGAYSVTFHAESTDKPVAVARRLREIGARAGLAVKPGTDIEPYLELMPEFDQILVMTVEPGFGGQKFMPENLIKVQAARAEIERLGLEVRLQVDGGVDEATIVDCASAGAVWAVAIRTSANFVMWFGIRPQLKRRGRCKNGRGWCHPRPDFDRSEAIEVHHLGPCLGKVPYELFFAIIGGIDFRNGPQLGIRAEDQIDRRCRPLDLACGAIGAFIQAFIGARL